MFVDICSEGIRLFKILHGLVMSINKTYVDHYLLRSSIHEGTSKGCRRVIGACLHCWHCSLGTVAFHKTCLTSYPHTALSSLLLIPAPFDQYYCLEAIN